MVMLLLLIVSMTVSAQQVYVGVNDYGRQVLYTHDMIGMTLNQKIMVSVMLSKADDSEDPARLTCMVSALNSRDLIGFAGIMVTSGKKRVLYKPAGSDIMAYSTVKNRINYDDGIYKSELEAYVNRTDFGVLSKATKVQVLFRRGGKNILSNIESNGNPGKVRKLTMALYYAMRDRGIAFY